MSMLADPNVFANMVGMPNYANMVTSAVGSGAMNQVPAFQNMATALTHPQSGMQSVLQRQPGLQPNQYSQSPGMTSARGDIQKRTQEGAGLAEQVPKLIERYARLGESVGRRDARNLAHRFAGQRGSNVGGVIARELEDAATARELGLGNLLSSLLSSDASARAQASGQALQAEQVAAGLERQPQQDTLALLSALVGMGQGDFGNRLATSQFLANLEQAEPSVQAQLLANITGAANAPFAVQGQQQSGGSSGILGPLGAIAGGVLPFLINQPAASAYRRPYQTPYTTPSFSLPSTGGYNTALANSLPYLIGR